MTPKDLIDGLNAAEFLAFPQKNDHDVKRVTLSIKAGTGKRHFLTRVSTDQLAPDGKPEYKWALGKELRAKN